MHLREYLVDVRKISLQQSTSYQNDVATRALSNIPESVRKLLEGDTFEGAVAIACECPAQVNIFFVAEAVRDSDESRLDLLCPINTFGSQGASTADACIEDSDAQLYQLMVTAFRQDGSGSHTEGKDDDVVVERARYGLIDIETSSCTPY